MFKTIFDQTGEKLEFNDPPKRIISLVPSQTELLFDLGLQEQIVGITKFCIHPKEKVEEKIKIGGTKNFKIEKILALNPDVIIANREENTKEGIEQLRKEVPVWTSNIKNLEDALEMIKKLGDLTGKDFEANEITTNIRNGFKSLPKREKKSAIYLIWRNPFMTIGGDTFINEMMTFCGLENAFKNRDRYPSITFEEIIESKPEVVLLSSEPYPFKSKHIHELKELCPLSNVLLVDGEMFSWYGSRLLKAVPYFKNVLEIISQ